MEKSSTEAQQMAAGPATREYESMNFARLLDDIALQRAPESGIPIVTSLIQTSSLHRAANALERIDKALELIYEALLRDEDDDGA